MADKKKKENEKKTTKTKRERFLEVGGKRINNAIRSIKLIGNCAAPVSYEYTKQDIEKLTAALNGALKETVGKFEAQLNKGVQEKFSFGETAKTSETPAA